MKVDLSQAWIEHERMAQSVPTKLRATLGGAFTPRALALRVAHETLSKFPRNDAPTVIDPCCGLGALMLAAVEWACVSRPQWVKAWLQGGKLQGWDISRELCDGTGRVLAIAGKCLGLQVRARLVIRDALESDDREICDAVIACPDPHCGGRFLITRTGRRRFTHAGTTGLPDQRGTPHWAASSN